MCLGFEVCASDVYTQYPMRATFDLTQVFSDSGYGAFTLYCAPFQATSPCPMKTFRLIAPHITSVSTGIQFTLFGFRSPLLTESQLFSFPAGTKMFQFPACPHSVECNSEILGSKAACASPRLFTACHVLHKLPSQAIPCMVLKPTYSSIARCFLAYNILISPIPVPRVRRSNLHPRSLRPETAFFT